ncbi:DinB family protein [Dehalogenimonas formicexedens]|nr:DinB family protein [Dehalogenimonas formicexedens]
METLGRRQLLDSFVNVPDQLHSVLESIDPEIVKWVPAPGEWSIRQVIFHVADGEANYYIRFRKAIAEPGGAVVAFDQNRWADSLDYPGRSVEESLNLFRMLRSLSYELMAQLPDSAWANTVEHSERGTLTLENLLAGAEGHVREHLKQIEDNVKRFKSKG